MAIHDVDRSPERQSPMPNTHDSSFVGDGMPIINQPRPSHGTNSVNYTTDASPSGQSAILAGNARLIKGGVITVSAPAGSAGVITTTSTVFAHGLGYAPLALCFMNNIIGGGYGIQLPMWVSFGDNTGGVGGAPEYLGVIRYMTFGVDSTNLTILTYSSGSAVASSYQITYYLYQQTVQ